MNWRDVPGWFDFQDIYDEAVAEASWERPAHFVEVGAAFGRSTIYMADKIRQSGKVTIAFDAVDIWVARDVVADRPHDDPEARALRRYLRDLCVIHGGMLEAFQHFVRECGVTDNINVIRCDQILVTKLYYQPASLDFVFLDTCHTEEGTRAAITAWLPKIRPGGIFAGHDFVPGWPCVVAAVKALLPDAVARGNSFYWRAPGGP